MAEDAAAARVPVPVSESPHHPEVIGVIGTGLMGLAIAERLRASGFAVLGFDVNAGQLEALKRLGGEPAGSAPEVAAGARRIMLSLPDHEVTATVLRELAPALRRDQIIVDTTTGTPEEAERQSATLASRGVKHLDAMIAGSSAQVADGTAVVMCGGEAAAFSLCLDLFRTFSSRAIHTGASGSGARMKLVSNLVLGLNRAALAEGLVFADALGLDPAQALEILTAGNAYSRIMDTKGGKMIRGDFTPQAKLSQHLKDVRLMLGAAGAANLQLPLTMRHRELLEKAEALGFGASDNSAIIRALQKRS